MRIRSVVPALALLTLSLPVGAAADGVASRDPAPARITVDSASPEWTRLVEWALDRFHEAGLRLPPMAISVHRDSAACGGNSGLYLPQDPPQVHLCSTSPVETRTARLTTLHELAHAWAETQLTADERAAFLHLRGLAAWYDPRIPRHERGMEHAAEVVSWGLMDEMVPIIRIYDAEPAQLSIAFDLLVGRPPLWG